MKLLLSLGLAVAAGCQSLSPEDQVMKAQRLYREAVRLHEEGQVAADVNGMTLDDNVKFARSLDKFREAALLAPDYLQLRFDLGRALYAEGTAYQNRQSVQFEQELALRTDGKGEEADRARDLGRSWQEKAQARFREAKPHFQKVVQAEGKPPEMEAQGLYCLGWIHLFLGDLDQALRYLKQAREVVDYGEEDQKKLDAAIKEIEDELVRQRIEQGRAAQTGASGGAPAAR